MWWALYGNYSLDGLYMIVGISVMMNTRVPAVSPYMSVMSLLTLSLPTSMEYDQRVRISALCNGDFLNIHFGYVKLEFFCLCCNCR